MATFSPIPDLASLKHKTSPLYFSSCYHYALEVLGKGGMGCELPFLKDQNDLKHMSVSLRNASENCEMLDDTTIFSSLQLLVEASKKCPDKKARARTLDELREYPEIYVCDPIVTEQFATVALYEVDRDLDAGYEKLSKKFAEAVQEGNSILFPIHHHDKIETQYEDAETKERLSCASDTPHWTLVFAHCRSRGRYDIYHYDSLPYRNNLMYAFKTTHAMLDAVARNIGGTPVVISAAHCSFSDRPRWPFTQIVPPTALRSIESMSMQESGSSCGLFVLGYGLLLAVMRSPLKKSAAEQITEPFAKLFGKFMYHIFLTFVVANTKS